MTAASLLRTRFGSEPAGVWSAPGRVNLIGEHTDYNGGLALPFAIAGRAKVAVGFGRRSMDRVVSAQRRGDARRIPVDDLRPGAPAAAGWAGYLLGVIWTLRQDGRTVPALDLALDSAVPAGAGLSSSAAVECAVALAISDLLDLGLPPAQLARVAQRAENDFVGMPCGLMDQMASMACTAGHALFFDAGATTVEQVPFDPTAARLAVLAINTRAHHALADGEYAKRRAECEAAAAALSVHTLSDLAPGDLGAALPRLDAEVLRRRVRHVVTENDRVRRVVGLLRAGHVGRIGPELSASHASLRDDFEVSCEELDVAASTAESAGALGARMVGGGFGGSVIALVAAGEVARVRRAVTDAFAADGFRAPEFRTVTPEGGAARDR